MANRFAVANGNFNATSTWSTTAGGAGGASVPGVGDTAMANSKTVTINVNSQCDSITTDATGGATASGGFTLAAGVTFTGNVVAGGSTCLTFASNTPNTGAIVGNVTAGNASNAMGLTHSGSGALTVAGNVTGGSGSTAIGINFTGIGTLTVTGNVLGGSSTEGIRVASAGTLIVNGNLTGGSGTNVPAVNNNSNSVNVTITGTVTGGSGNTAAGVQNSSTGTVTIVGNATGGSIGLCYGILNIASGTINITGNVTGGTIATAYGAYNSSTGTINVTGDAIASNTTPGAFNNSSGTLKVVTAIGNGFGAGSAGGITSQPGVVSSISGSLTYVQKLQFGVLGQSPTSGPILLTDVTSNTCSLYRVGLSQKVLSDPAAVAGTLPAASDVRYGTVYNLGGTTGTCYVPAAGSVALGVPVDATTGTAVLTSAAIFDTARSTLTTANSIGALLNNVATVASTGQQIANAITAN